MELITTNDLFFRVVSLTFFGGVGKIGGNKIVLRDKDTKILLDFGLDFSLNSAYYAWPFFRPRAFRGLHDYFGLGLLPDIKGLYRRDLLARADLPVEDTEFNFIAISHGHMDHVGCVPFTHESIPVGMGKVTMDILAAVSANRYDLESEFTEVGHVPDGKLKADESPPSRPLKDWVQREIRPFTTGDTISCDGIDIEPIHVDHSIPGAYGFIIHASDATIAYTGDLRLHGTRPQLTRDFVEAAAKAKPDALITEGTNVSDRSDQGSEGLVKKKLSSSVKRSKKLVMAGFDFKNVDRLRTMYELARENGRRLVIPLKKTALYEALANDPKLGLPAVKDLDIAVYVPRRNYIYPDGTYPVEEYDEDQQALLARKGVTSVTCQQVRARESKFLLALDYWDFNELLDIKPSSGSLYLYSKTEPFNEEMEIGYGRTKAWLERFQFNVRNAHCSGHASRSDLFGIIKEIGAKKVIPIHTEHPDMFSRFSLVTPAMGKTIRVVS
jgi:ribonuclease J